MKCIICHKYSFRLICNHCQSSYLTPSISKRVLPDGFIVYSFYGYGDVEPFLRTKHTVLGSYVYKILAKNSFAKFSNFFPYSYLVHIIPIDDNVKSGYSHTAILANQMKSRYMRPVFSSLRSQNNVRYSGKSLDFRLKNKRNFLYSYKSNIDVIIVDDIITTGTTISEAKFTLEKSSVNPLFAITLADARQK